MKFIVRLSKKLLIILIILSVCFAIVEGLARLILGGDYPMNQSDPETVRQRLLSEHVTSQLLQRHPDDKVCFDLRPGSGIELFEQRYTINSQGMRGPEAVKEKPAGAFRIAMVGDSFAFGWGSDDPETIPAQMEGILREGGLDHDRFEVLNFGIPGYQLGQMKEHLIRKVNAFSPDILIVIMNANDVVRKSLHFNTLYKGLYEDFLPLPYSWKPFLWRSFIIYRFVTRLQLRFRNYMGWTHGFMDWDQEYFKDQVRAIEAESAKHGISVLFVILPWPENFNNYIFQAHHDKMHELLAGSNFVDLFKHMCKYDVRDLWFRVDDHHFNGQANLAVARMILEELESRGMVRLKEAALPSDPLMDPLYMPGDFLLVDMDADPMNRGGHPGAVFRVSRDGKEISVVTADQIFREPLDCLLDDYGNLLVVDATADPFGQGSQGAVIRVNRFSGRTEAVVAAKEFKFPNALLLDDSGTLYISDKEADPQGIGKTGVLWKYNLKQRKLDLLLSGRQFISPSPLAWAPEGKIYLIDADSNPNGYEGTPGVLFLVDPVQGSCEPLIEFKDTVSPVGMIPLSDGRMIVIDANADPLNTGWFLGGLLMVDPAKRTYEFIFGSKKFLDPIRGELGSDGCLYFVDGNCDPLKLGVDGAAKGVEGHGRGAIWRFDLEKMELSLVASDPRFVNPMSVRIVPENL
jgi:hypothetical protein